VISHPTKAQEIKEKYTDAKQYELSLKERTALLRDLDVKIAQQIAANIPLSRGARLLCLVRCSYLSQEIFMTRILIFHMAGTEEARLQNGDNFIRIRYCSKPSQTSMKTRCIQIHVMTIHS